jgi:hypothetical protein
VLEPCLGDITERKETKNVKMLNMDLHLDFKIFSLFTSSAINQALQKLLLNKTITVD